MKRSVDGGFDDEFIETNETDHPPPTMLLRKITSDPGSETIESKLNVNLYTKCEIKNDVVQATTNTHRYTEICYIVEEKNGNQVYNFYRNCSQARMSPFLFTFIDDIYSDSIFKRLTTSNNEEKLPPFPKSINVDLVHFNMEEDPDPYPLPYPLYESVPNTSITYLTKPGTAPPQKE